MSDWMWIQAVWSMLQARRERVRRNDQSDRGAVSAEYVILVGAIIVGATVIIGIIIAKITDKANSIHF